MIFHFANVHERIKLFHVKHVYEIIHGIPIILQEFMKEQNKFLSNAIVKPFLNSQFKDHFANVHE